MGTIEVNRIRSVALSVGCYFHRLTAQKVTSASFPWIFEHVLSSYMYSTYRKNRKVETSHLYKQLLIFVTQHCATLRGWFHIHILSSWFAWFAWFVVISDTQSSKTEGFALPVFIETDLLRSYYIIVFVHFRQRDTFVHLFTFCVGVCSIWSVAEDTTNYCIQTEEQFRYSLLSKINFERLFQFQNKLLCFTPA